MDQPYAIPGMMPLPAGEKISRLRDAAPDGSLRILLLEQPESEPPRSFQVQIHDAFDNLLLLDPTGANVYAIVQGGNRVYYYITTNTQFAMPRGTVFLKWLSMSRAGIDSGSVPISLKDGTFAPCNGPIPVAPRYTAAGQLELIIGDANVNIPLVPPMAGTPLLASATVLVHNIDTPQSITATVAEKTASYLRISLNAAPSTGGYYLAWAAWL